MYNQTAMITMQNHYNLTNHSEIGMIQRLEKLVITSARLIVWIDPLVSNVCCEATQQKMTVKHMASGRKYKNIVRVDPLKALCASH